MKAKEGKGVVARDYWSCRWQKELSLSKVVHASIVMFFHLIPSYAKKGPHVIHMIHEAIFAVDLANLEAFGAIMDGDVVEKRED